ncbi:MAG: YceI family protein [Actinobacteria bacterium]|nr:YceI family protein [Actinomycetota bacterium]
MNKVKTLVGVVVAAIVLVVGGVWVYINVIKDDAPEELSLDSPATTAPTDEAAPTSGGADDTATDTATAGVPFDGTLDGDWVPNGTQLAGYRVAETLAGQATEGVGRTDRVDGAFSIVGTTITEADFNVDMASMKSDSSRRDGQYNSRLMETDTYPTASFVLTQPIELGSEPAEGEAVSVQAIGDLTLKDTTKEVTFDLEARRDGATITVVATYEIVFADWGIEDPSNGFAQVGPSGLLEIRLELTKA